MRGKRIQQIIVDCKLTQFRLSDLINFSSCQKSVIANLIYSSSRKKGKMNVFVGWKPK